MSPDAIDALVRMGCTAQQVAEAVKADMLAHEAKQEEKRAQRREGNRRRQAAWREREQAKRNEDNEHNAVMQRDGVPPKERSPRPPKEITPSQTSEPVGSSVRTERDKRGSRVDGFTPDLDVALSMGFGDGQARFEAEKFTDFWRGKPGKDGVKLDWPATWRNWLRSSLQRNGPRLIHDNGRPPPKEHPRDQLKRDFLGAPDVRPFADYSTIDGQAYRTR